MRKSRVWLAVSAVVAATALLAPHTRAQEPFSLPISLFERYLDSLRQQAGIPGLSGAIIQEGKLVWDAGLGYQDADGLVRATAETPYPLLDVSQTIASTILLEQCVEGGSARLTDSMRRWNSSFAESATIGQVLSHTSAGDFQYDPGRYAALTEVLEDCGDDELPPLIANAVFNRFGMSASVPGHNLIDMPASRNFFTSGDYSRYASTLARVAPGYKVDSSRRVTKADYSKPSLTTSTGVVSTVRDMVRFDTALDAGALIDSDARNTAWQRVGSSPAGLGWFVQSHNGERVVWHFGLARDAYSALYIKVPGRKLTLILLATRDGLAAPYSLSNGDLSPSLFAQLFLKLFVS
jgi:CubicO group peptidase (beta-lactamase class C family)